MSSRRIPQGRFSPAGEGGGIGRGEKCQWNKDSPLGNGPAARNTERTEEGGTEGGWKGSLSEGGTLRKHAPNSFPVTKGGNERMPPARGTLPTTSAHPLRNGPVVSGTAWHPSRCPASHFHRGRAEARPSPWRASRKGRASARPCGWETSGQHAEPRLFPPWLVFRFVEAPRAGHPRHDIPSASQPRPSRRGAAGSRTSGSGAMVVRKVRRRVRGCGILPRHWPYLRRWEGGLPSCSQ